jgi:ribosomal protein S18 acetylase RimI-like enzyme
MRVDQATAADVPGAAAAIAAAFRTDPLISWFFHDHPLGRDVAADRFFGLLMRARIALRAPCLIAWNEDVPAGAAMGYTTQRAEWPDDFRREWGALESSSATLPERFAAYEAISERCVPTTPHYYLGTIGVLAAARGTGTGSALLRAFCALSAADPLSHGVYLETANPANLDFYGRHGFEVRGSGSLDGITLWCLFRSQ